MDPKSTLKRFLFKDFNDKLSEWNITNITFGHINNLDHSIKATIENRNEQHFRFSIHDTIRFQPYSLNQYLPMFEDAKKIISSNLLIQNQMRLGNIEHIICYFQNKQLLSYKRRGCSYDLPPNVHEKLNSSDNVIITNIKVKDYEEIAVYFLENGTLILTQIPGNYKLDRYSFEDIVSYSENDNFFPIHYSYKAIDKEGSLHDLK